MSHTAWSVFSCEIVAGVAQAVVAFLQPGEQIGQRQFKRIAADHRAPRIPTYSVVQRHADSAGRNTGQIVIKSERVARF